jgi:hypothetical protein
MRLDVLQFAAGEVIYDANSCTPLNQGIYQVGADEGCSAGDQNVATLPHLLHLLSNFE